MLRGNSSSNRFGVKLQWMMYSDSFQIMWTSLQLQYIHYNTLHILFVDDTMNDESNYK